MDDIIQNNKWDLLERAFQEIGDLHPRLNFTEDNVTTPYLYKVHWHIKFYIKFNDTSCFAKFHV